MGGRVVRVTASLGDPGDFYIRPGRHQNVDLVFRESDDAGVTIETSWDVLRCLLDNIEEVLEDVANKPPLPLDECGGGVLRHDAPHVPADVLKLATVTPDARLLAQFARRHAAPHLPDGGNAA
jgi:hypothetical protein